MTARWQDCASCRFKRRCEKAHETGCYHPVYPKDPEVGNVVDRARKMLSDGSSKEDTVDWLTAQYLEHQRDVLLRWRHRLESMGVKLPDPAATNEDGQPARLLAERFRLRIAEVAARGTVWALSRCPEPAGLQCDTCRFNSCKKKEPRGVL